MKMKRMKQLCSPRKLTREHKEDEENSSAVVRVVHQVSDRHRRHISYREEHGNAKKLLEEVRSRLNDLCHDHTVQDKDKVEKLEELLFLQGEIQGVWQEISLSRMCVCALKKDIKRTGKLLEKLKEEEGCKREHLLWQEEPQLYDVYKKRNVTPKELALLMQSLKLRKKTIAMLHKMTEDKYVESLFAMKDTSVPKHHRLTKNNISTPRSNFESTKDTVSKEISNVIQNIKLDASVMSRTTGRVRPFSFDTPTNQQVFASGNATNLNILQRVQSSAGASEIALFPVNAVATVDETLCGNGLLKQTTATSSASETEKTLSLNLSQLTQQSDLKRDSFEDYLEFNFDNLDDDDNNGKTNGEGEELDLLLL